jgi:hypothetical protein
VLRRQADSYNDLLKNAKKYNLELPAAMRPVLEEMLRMGLLLDDNGNKLEDLNGFSFAPAIAVWDEFGQTGAAVSQEMKKGFDAVAGSIRDITKASVSAKTGLEDMGKAVPRPGAGSGGASTASTGTPGMAGAQGDPILAGGAAGVAAAVAAMRSGMGMTVVINANGVDSRVDSWRRFMAEGGVAELVDYLRRAGGDREDMKLALGVA